jgi:hypothetical protein
MVAATIEDDGQTLAAAPTAEPAKSRGRPRKDGSPAQPRPTSLKAVPPPQPGKPLGADEAAALVGMLMGLASEYTQDARWAQLATTPHPAAIGQALAECAAAWDFKVDPRYAALMALAMTTLGAYAAFKALPAPQTPEKDATPP